MNLNLLTFQSIFSYLFSSYRCMLKYVPKLLQENSSCWNSILFTQGFLPSCLLAICPTVYSQTIGHHPFSLFIVFLLCFSHQFRFPYMLMSVPASFLLVNWLPWFVLLLISPLLLPFSFILHPPQCVLQNVHWVCKKRLTHVLSNRIYQSIPLRLMYRKKNVYIDFMFILSSFKASSLCKTSSLGKNI
jgi:hypothetical protein